MKVYSVTFIVKDNNKRYEVLDKYIFRDKKEAETYAGIESLQMECDKVIGTHIQEHELLNKIKRSEKCLKKSV